MRGSESTNHLNPFVSLGLKRCPTPRALKARFEGRALSPVTHNLPNLSKISRRRFLAGRWIVPPPNYLGQTVQPSFELLLKLGVHPIHLPDVESTAKLTKTPN
jgi:hypothetical protein